MFQQAKIVQGERNSKKKYDFSCIPEPQPILPKEQEPIIVASQN